ncbi:hypothetical protein CCR75_005437 [Bremia lactucae]|uniref:Transmembrane protein n=1 Tax=Bremia lactucae TaxID=4779 RepID=A0A976IBY9_BRELC|nr:hypothetical protein CCR75_005437 [Bremia lactucae]
MSDTKLKSPSKARRVLLQCSGFIASRCLSLCICPRTISPLLTLTLSCFSWGTYLLGLLWLLLHPAITITTGELKCRGTYMSENALLIDLMEAQASHQEAHSARKFQQKLQNLPHLSPSGCRDNCSDVVDWITTQLRGVDRVEAYNHVFQTDQASARRTNVYGILQASPLADGKEAIVLVTHYRNVGTNTGDISGLALGLAMLKYLASATWLAKNVILLAADDGALDGSDGYAPGTGAYLQAYHLDPVVSGIQGVLPMRAGVIRAAINLETLSNSRPADTMGIFTAGMNGQLPNLDLVNTAVRALRRHQIPTTLNRQQDNTSGFNKLNFFKDLNDLYTPPRWKESLRNYLTNLDGMLQFMVTVATGPTGPHANFISYNIDSITLSLTTRETPEDRPLAVRNVMRSLEMVIRALSNLEEKLHQSFFLYVLPNTTTFVSVGEYIYAVLLVLSPAIVHLLSLATQTTGMRIALALSVVFVIEALCVLLLFGICQFLATPTASLHSLSFSEVSAAQWFQLATVVSVAQVFIALVITPSLRSVVGFSGCVEVFDWKRKLKKYEAEQLKKLLPKSSSDDTKEIGAKTILNSSNGIPPLDSGWRAIKFITMIMLVYFLGILGLLNYPMALFCAIPMVHFARVVPFDTATTAQNIWNGLWLLVSSPLMVLFLLSWRRQGVGVGLSYIVNSFAQRLNLLALMYICCIYVVVHTLSLTIFTFSCAVPSGKKTKCD